jgi:hypothetical protein
MLDDIKAQRMIAEEFYSVSWSSTSSPSQLFQYRIVYMEQDTHNDNDVIQFPQKQELFPHNSPFYHAQQQHIPLHRQKLEFMRSLEDSTITPKVQSEMLAILNINDKENVFTSSSDVDISSKSYEDSFQVRARLFLQQYNEESLHSTSISQSPTEYIRKSSFVTEPRKVDSNQFRKRIRQENTQRDNKCVTSLPTTAINSNRDNK